MIDDNYSCRSCCHRFQARLEESSDDLDNASSENLEALRTHAQRLIADSDERLDRVARVPT